MTDFILVTGDKVSFLPTFEAATVTVLQLGILTGTGTTTRNGQKVCVDGDETKVSVLACPYFTPQYSIPGTGTLKIKALAADQLAKKTNTGGKAVLLKGKQFDAVFEVDKLNPAKQPNSPSPIPDQKPSYNGKGSFITMNSHFKGS